MSKRTADARTINDRGKPTLANGIALRRPAVGRTASAGGLAERLQQAEAERDALRRSVEDRDEQIRLLSARLDLIAGREGDLTAMLLAAHERIFAAHVPAPTGDAGRAGGRGAAGFTAYHRLVEQVRATVRATVAPGATVVVVSKGDESLVTLDGATGWHFPQSAGGAYAGHHPADSSDAIRHLEALRARGGSYLLLPATSFWWLDHYRELAQYLDAKYERVDAEACVIWKLFRAAAAVGAAAVPASAAARNGSPQE
jgi:hypothetical protein